MRKLLDWIFPNKNKSNDQQNAQFPQTDSECNTDQFFRNCFSGTYTSSLLKIKTGYFHDESVKNKFTLLGSKSTSLPVDLWLISIVHLNIKDMIMLSLSCKLFYNLIFNNHNLLNKLFLEKCKKFPEISILNRLPSIPQPSLGFENRHRIFNSDEKKLYHFPDDRLLRLLSKPTTIRTTTEDQLVQPGPRGFIMKNPMQ